MAGKRPAIEIEVVPEKLEKPEEMAAPKPVARVKRRGVDLLVRPVKGSDVPYESALEMVSGRARLMLEDEYMLPPNEVAEVYAEAQQRFNLSTVIDGAAVVTGILPIMFKGETRKRPVVRARQAVFWIGHACMGMSLKQVGALLGDRDHTTVLHGVNKMIEEAGLEDEIGRLARARARNIMRATLLVNGAVRGLLGIDDVAKRAIARELRELR
jgi:hypothetical protein